MESLVKIARRAAPLLLFLGALLSMPTAHADYGTGVSAMDMLQLPKFCWKQMGVANATGPQFDFPRELCGPGMNHYCPGLVDLIKAKRTSNRHERTRMLNRVERDAAYTEKWMSGFPKCPIRSHVEATKAEIKRLRALK